MIRSRLHHIPTPLLACAILAQCGIAHGAETESTKVAKATETPPAEAQQKIFIREIRVAGTQTLPRIEVEEAVYPFLGPGRTFTDVEGRARRWRRRITRRATRRRRW